MNHSIYSADRTTHLKIVVVALVAGIAVAGFAISARMSADDGYTQTARDHQGREADGCYEFGRDGRPLKEFEGIHEASLHLPPEVAT